MPPAAAAFLHQHQLHPEWMAAIVAYLWSINERLGGVLAQADPHARCGAALPPLSPDWMCDVVQAAREESDVIKQQLEEHERELLKTLAQ